MKIELDRETLVPLIEQVVAETLRQVDQDRAQLGDRLGFTEREAAELLGLPRHSLRDARLRGEISASRIGRRVLYRREELENFLRRNQSG